MLRITLFTALSVVLAVVFAPSASGDPDEAKSPTVSGGSTRTVGEAPEGADECEGDDEGDDEGCPDQGCDEVPDVPMVYRFSSPKMSFINATKDLFKKYPGQAKFEDVRKEKGEYVLIVHVKPSNGKADEDFYEKFERMIEQRKEDHSWGCGPDDEEMKKQFEGEGKESEKGSENDAKKDKAAEAEKKK